MKSLFVGDIGFQTTSAVMTALFQPLGRLGRIHIPLSSFGRTVLGTQ
jgi:hypothetical protein